MPPERRTYAAVAAATAAAANAAVVVVANHSLRVRRTRVPDPLQATPQQVEDAVRERPLVTYERKEFVLDDYDDGTCVRFFRFNRTEIRELIMWFQLHWLEYRNRYRPSQELAICITLYRLSSPNRYMDNHTMFGRSAAFQSSVFNDVVVWLSTRFGKKLFWDRRLTYWQLEEYADAVERTSGGVKGIWGFVDGTQREICRPTEDQRTWYSGFKKAHTVKFQAIIAPDGLIVHLAGPYEGKLGDWRCWGESDIEVKLRETHIPFPEPDDRLYVYGDPAYTQGYGVMGAFKATTTTPLTQEEKDCNVEMSRLRISVEHGFGKLMNHWGFIGYRKGLKIGQSPVGAYIQVAVLLSNCHTCLNGSQTSKLFGISPPSLARYMAM